MNRDQLTQIKERWDIFRALTPYFGRRVPARFIQRTGEKLASVRQIHPLIEGIYKPKDQHYCLSIASMLKNPYSDRSDYNADGSWLSIGSNYIWMDLDIEVPESLAIEVKDSSGDMSLKNVAVVQIKDSSGDIKVEKARDSFTVSDSSGDIEIDGADGDLTIESDSSGDIEITDIHGTVLVMNDSSGDIEATDVTDNFVVERDSSGDISANDIGGDFRVLKDGSGNIKSRDVQGEVDIPAKD